MSSKTNKSSKKITLIKPNDLESEQMNSFADSVSDEEYSSGESEGSNSDEDSNSDEGSEEGSQYTTKISDVYDPDEDDSEEEISDASENYEEKDLEKEENTKFFSNIVKYLQIDDLVKKKRAEFKEDMKELSEDKNDLEAYILRYLTKTGSEFVDVGDKVRLTKVQSTRQKPITTDNIREGILEQLRAEKLVDKEEAAIELINSMMEAIGKKRGTETKEYIKRENKKKGKKGKGKKGKGKKGKGKDKGKDEDKIQSKAADL